MVTRRQDRACDDRHRILVCVDQLTPTVLADLVRRGRYTTTPDGHRTVTRQDGMPHGKSEYVGVEAAADKRAFGGTEDVKRVQRDPTGDDIRNLFVAVIGAGVDAAETLAVLQPLWAPTVDDSAPGVPEPQRAAQTAIVAIRHCVAVCDDTIIRSDDPLGCSTIESIYGKTARAFTLLRQVRKIELEETTRGAHRLGGLCMCCSKEMVGSFEDRLRGGLCPRCYTAHRRYEGPADRQQWIRDERQRLLDEKDEVAA
jgi:hypothetical protein